MWKRDAFTLIEFVIVIIIVGILVILAIPIYWASLRRAYSVEGFITLGAIRKIQHLYHAEFSTYLPTTDISTDMGLDTANNRFWNNPAFAVTVTGTGAAATFTATATGDNSTAPGRDKIAGIVLTINERGVITGY